MHDGIIPIITGVGVVTSGMLTKHKLPELGSGLIGFGLAHIILGALSYKQEECEIREVKWGIPVGRIKQKIKDQL